MSYKINPLICPQNHRCPIITECPEGAISQIGYDGLPVIDETKCTECGNCIPKCAPGAVEKELSFRSEIS